MKHILSVFFCLLFTLSPFAQSLEVDTILTIETKSRLAPKLDFKSNQGLWRFSGPQKLDSSNELPFVIDWQNASNTIYPRLSIESSTGDVGFKTTTPQASVDIRHRLASGVAIRTDGMGGDPGEGLFLNGGGRNKLKNWASISAGYYSNYNKTIARSSKASGINFVNGNILFKTIYGANVGANSGIPVRMKIDSIGNVIVKKQLLVNNGIIADQTIVTKNDLKVSGSTYIGDSVVIGGRDANPTTLLDVRVKSDEGVLIRPRNINTGAGLYMTSGGRDKNPSWSAISTGTEHNMFSYKALRPEAASMEFRNGNIHFKTRNGLTVGNNFPNNFPTRLLIGADGAISIPGKITSAELTVNATATVNRANVKIISANQLEVTGESVFASGLYSRGTIKAQEVIIEMADASWPDYVFNSDYSLRPLNEVEKHIKENGHLPEVPSASQVAEDGVSVGEMNRVLLQKVEELTLYMIEQQKRIEELESIVKQ